MAGTNIGKRKNCVNCALRLVTLGCCYQIHCRPHTESQCSAENHCLEIFVIYVLQENVIIPGLP